MSRGRVSLVVWLTGAGAILIADGGCTKAPASPPPATAAAAVPVPPASVSAPEIRPAPVAPEAPRRCDARLGPDGLRRAAVLRTLDAGLGTWLREIDVDPKLERGRFRGWIVRTLPGDGCFAGLDLQVGDVVTRVNGHRIERPGEANEVWEGLRTSPALEIDFLRNGHPRTLHFNIVDQ